jgi:CubicO group peptidase (beta-lactamase class C family)
MKKYFYFCLLAFSTVCFSIDYDFSSYTNYLTKEINKGNYPGFVTLIYKNGEIIFSDTRGFSDIEEEIPLKEDSLFRIYSMTKPITGVALMILVEQGKVSLSDPVEKYIPEFKNTKVFNKKSKQLETLSRSLTILDLATHSSGLTYSFVDKGKVKEIYDREEIYPYYFLDNISLERPAKKSYSDNCTFSEKVATLPLVHQPGEKWTYSIGMDILGCVIERAANQSFGEFLKKNIFDPLDMKDTFFEVPGSKQNRMIDLYAHKKGFPRYGVETPDMKNSKNRKLFLLDPKEDSFFFQKASIEDGGSGLVSTANDYLKFATMLLNNGSLNGRKILKPETVKIMTSNQVEKKAKPFGFDAFGMGVTIGVALDAKKMRMKRGDNSFFWGGAANTDFWVDPSNDLIFISMSQVLGSPEIDRKLERLVYKALGI